MTCARCGLSLRLRGAPLSLDRCPRCFAFAGVSMPLGTASAPPLGTTSAPPLGTVSAPPLGTGSAPPLTTGSAPPPALPPARATTNTTFGHLVVSTANSGQATVLSLQGKLDIASERCLEQALRRAWAVGCTEMVIDLGGLEFMDAAGMKVLLMAREYMLEHGTRLFLAPGPPIVQRMFQLTGTLELFSFRT